MPLLQGFQILLQAFKFWILLWESCEFSSYSPLCVDSGHAIPRRVITRTPLHTYMGNFRGVIFHSPQRSEVYMFVFKELAGKFTKLTCSLPRKSKERLLPLACYFTHGKACGIVLSKYNYNSLTWKWGKCLRHILEKTKYNKVDIILVDDEEPRHL